MSVVYVKIGNVLIFRGELAVDFCPGINVFIGDNGTGKTTLLKEIYSRVSDDALYKSTQRDSSGNLVAHELLSLESLGTEDESIFSIATNTYSKPNCIFIPEKDILEHAQGLLPFIEKKQTGFSHIYRDVLIAAMDIPTQAQSNLQKSVVDKVADITGGQMIWDLGTNSFYTKRHDGTLIPFANEASAYKKLGLLGSLASTGQFESDAILFWDEPENSLNPELVPVLVDILLELARNGVQVFIASHDYNIVRYFDIRANKDIPVAFHCLSKRNDGKIVCTSSPNYIKLPDNHLERAGEDLYEAVIADAMGVQRDG